MEKLDEYLSSLGREANKGNEVDIPAIMSLGGSWSDMVDEEFIEDLLQHLKKARQNLFNRNTDLNL